MNCCNQNCNQGDCMGSVNASRVALGLAPLHRDDAPIYSPTDMQAAAFGTWQSIKWGGFVALCVVAAVYWPY